ncbi:MAG: hypothetical protein ACKOZW_13150 [Cyanobium sp.]
MALALVLATAPAVLLPGRPGGPSAAQAEPTRPQPPPPRKVLYDPDQATCQPAHVERTFAEQLKPWADQSEAVQARLRQVQAEMLQGSLRRCVARGLLGEAEAQALMQRLLASPHPSGQRP